MGEGNLLSLRWNNHISNFKFTLGQLQQKELFSDATIACEGQFYPVHKFVLSTCSDYFASMFERTPCKHPVIVLSDVSSKDAEYLLSYMYGGEVSVSQTDLPSLIRVAETLQIKGLSAPDDPPLSPASYKTKRTNAEGREEENPSKKVRFNENSSSVDKTSIQSSVKEEIVENFGLINEGETGDDPDESTEICLEFSTEDSIHLAGQDNFLENTDFQALQVKQEKEEVALADSSNSREEPSFELKSNRSTLATSSDSDSVSWPSSFIPCSSTSSNIITSNNNNNNNDNNSDKNNSTRSNISGNMNPRSNPLYPRQPSESGENCQTVDFRKRVVGEREENLNGSIISADYGITVPDGALQHSLSSFRCPLCEYATHNRSWLFIHIRKHTGEKPFCCPFCSFRSAQRGNLNVHIKKLHSSLSSSSQNS